MRRSPGWAEQRSADAAEASAMRLGALGLLRYLRPALARQRAVSSLLAAVLAQHRGRRRLSSDLPVVREPASRASERRTRRSSDRAPATTNLCR